MSPRALDLVGPQLVQNSSAAYGSSGATHTSVALPPVTWNTNTCWAVSVLPPRVRVAFTRATACSSSARIAWMSCWSESVSCPIRAKVPKIASLPSKSPDTGVLPDACHLASSAMSWSSVAMSPVAKASKPFRTRSAFGCAITPPSLDVCRAHYSLCTSVESTRGLAGVDVGKELRQRYFDMSSSPSGVTDLRFRDWLFCARTPEHWRELSMPADSFGGRVDRRRA